MPDEQDYVAHLLDYEQAIRVLHPDEGRVVKYAFHLLTEDMAIRESIRAQQLIPADSQPADSEAPQVNISSSNVFSRFSNISFRMKLHRT
jgi:hypothetical protein